MTFSECTNVFIVFLSIGRKRSYTFCTSETSRIFFLNKTKHKLMYENSLMLLQILKPMIYLESTLSINVHGSAVSIDRRKQRYLV